MILNKGIVLGHHVQSEGIKVEPNMIEIILKQATPTTQKDVHGFLGYAGYYCRFIENFTTITSTLFHILRKVANIS